MSPAPLIVTAELPPAIFAWADALRRTHYSPDRNQLAAHVTLFHALPPSLEGEARTRLALMARVWGPVPAVLSGIMDLGRGTALAIQSPAMLAIRAALADELHGSLTTQDGHLPRLHVTIQNKVLRETARNLQAELAEAPFPRSFRFSGLALHRYLGGPWEPAGKWSFRGKEGG